MYDRRVLALLPQLGVAVRHLQLPGVVSRSERSRPRRNRAVARRRGGRRRRHRRRPGLWRHAGRAHRARARADRRARAPSAVPGGRALPRRGRTQLHGAGESGAGAGQADRRHQRGDGAHVGSRTSRCPADKITVAEPGTDPAPRAPGSAAGPLQLLSVGSIVPRKAYDILVRALGTLKDRDWRLTIAGPTDRSPEALAALRAAIARDRPRRIASPSSAPVSQERAGRHVRVGRCLPPAVALRGLRHGAGRGHGARTADRLHDRRRGGRDGAGRRRHQGAARRRARAHAAVHRVLRRAGSAPPPGRCVLGGRPEAAALGGYGAHHRRRHQGGRP